MDFYSTNLINGFAGQHETLDLGIRWIANSHLFKGTIAMMLFWACWFVPVAEKRDKQARLISVILAAFLAMGIAILSNKLLPFRFRPVASGIESIQIPIGMNSDWTNAVSAFPSDHAVMFFTIAVGIFMVSHRFGLVALFHAAVIVCLPRIYLGLHWPTDILAGALLGTFVAILMVPLLQKQLLRFGFATMPERFDPWLYALLFFVTAQAATMFERLRELAKLLLELFGIQLH